MEGEEGVGLVVERGKAEREKEDCDGMVVEWKGKSTCDGWKTGVGMEEKKLTEKRKMVVVMVVLEERDEGLQDPILFGNSVHD